MGGDQIKYHIVASYLDHGPNLDKWIQRSIIRIKDYQIVEYIYIIIIIQPFGLMNILFNFYKDNVNLFPLSNQLIYRNQWVTFMRK